MCRRRVLQDEYGYEQHDEDQRDDHPLSSPGRSSGLQRLMGLIMHTDPLPNNRPAETSGERPLKMTPTDHCATNAPLKPSGDGDLGAEMLPDIGMAGRGCRLTDAIRARLELYAMPRYLVERSFAVPSRTCLRSPRARNASSTPRSRTSPGDDRLDCRTELFHFSCKEGYPRQQWRPFAPCSPATSERPALTPCAPPGA